MQNSHQEWRLTRNKKKNKNRTRLPHNRTSLISSLQHRNQFQILRDFINNLHINSKETRAHQSWLCQHHSIFISQRIKLTLRSILIRKTNSLIQQRREELNLPEHSTEISLRSHSSIHRLLKSMRQWLHWEERLKIKRFKKKFINKTRSKFVKLNKFVLQVELNSHQHLQTIL
jgi:hypothetical protein